MNTNKDKDKGSFRVWCVNNDEWERHGCALTQCGILVTIRGFKALSYNPDSHIVEKYLNFEDVNKKPIYVGDIVKVQAEYYTEYGEFNEDEPFDIVVVKEKGIVDIEGDDYKCTLLEWVHDGEALIEILGNIHENKKLLEA